MKRSLILVSLLAWAAIRLPAGSAPDSKKVHAEGCVEAGAEAGCLVVKDVKSGKLYNLLFKDRHPKVGEGIEFNGVLHEGVTMCMQGTAVEVSNWARKDSLKCDPGDKESGQ